MIGAGLLALLQFAPAADFLTALGRPVITGILALAGHTTIDQGDSFRIGTELIIPWSQDCAGVNSLTLLIGFLMWSWRKQEWSKRFWIQAALLLPMAIAANVARVLTIILWRTAFYPEVEGLQLHFLISFLWLLPATAFLSPPVGKGGFFQWPSQEILYFGVILAWLNPLIFTPGGTLAAIATMTLLIQNENVSKVPAWIVAVWIAMAVGIASMAMESLWLPWLLVCPWFCQIKRHGTRLLLLPATITILSVNPWLIAFTTIVLIWELRKFVTQVDEPESSEQARLPILIPVLLCLPFLLGNLSPPGIGLQLRNLPPSVQIKEISESNWEVRPKGSILGAYWFDAQGGGRHHTLEVCMRYRGVILKQVPEQPEVWIGPENKFWLREFFLVGEQWLSYRQYLRKTFYPFAPVGNHIIVFAPKSTASSADFVKLSEEFLKELLP